MIQNHFLADSTCHFFLHIMCLFLYPKNPWDVMGCQNHLFGGPFRGVTFGGSGFSIGGVRILRVGEINWKPPLRVEYLRLVA